VIEDGRIRCINPRCRRTAAVEKHPDSDEIVCGKCWRSVPLALRSGLRALEKRERRVLRLIDRRVAVGAISERTIEHLRTMFVARHDAIWQRIRNYFVVPDKPAGLEGFLAEIGL
jgi:hypothetical protein